MPKHNRKSIRLPDYDYSQPGAYFVTICVQGHKCVLGEIVENEMQPNQFGEITAAGWKWLEEKFPSVQIDVLCVMPNHVHAIISIVELENNIPKNASRRGGLQSEINHEAHDQRRGVLQNAPTESNIQKRKPLGRLVGAYKTHTTVQINKLRATPGEKFWQRNYYEHIIRDEKDYETIYEYIRANPLRWEEDDYHPNPQK